jgi:hypothetical protein
MRERIGILLLWTGLLFGERLAPVGPGVPADLGGEIRAEQKGAHPATRGLPEPGGKVLARSVSGTGGEKDALESPAVEDRVRWTLRYRSAGGRAKPEHCGQPAGSLPG